MATKEINVKDYFAFEDGANDDTEAFSRAFLALKSTHTQVGNDTYVKNKMVIPPGIYVVKNSINWTGLSDMNATIEAYGAVILGKCKDKNVIDTTGTLGLHVKGLTIVGDQYETPKCAVLAGPINTATCGINSWQDCKFIGFFSVASFWNHGSETTQYIGCRFANKYPAAETYAYLGDGVNRFNAKSDYRSIRAVGVAVSFTANIFEHCSLRNWATDTLGGSVWLENTNTWAFGKTCYFLSFIGPNVRIRSDGTYRTTGLTLKGLFETGIAPGVDYCVEFIVSNGEASACADIDWDFAYPLCKLAVIKMTETGGGVTTGTLTVAGTIRITGTSVAGVDLFNAPTMKFIGDIHCRTASTLNFANTAISSVSGNLYVDDWTQIPITVNSTANKLIAFDNTHGSIAIQSQNVIMNCMPNSDTAGALTFARSLGQADRNSSIEPFNSATQASNYIRLKVHNGTVGAKNNTLTAYGDGRVEIGDPATQNVWRLESDLTGATDINAKATGAGTNISMKFTPKGTGTMVINLANCPAFANDAAAAAGGVPVGGLYRIANAVQIRIA